MAGQRQLARRCNEPFPTTRWRRRCEWSRWERWGCSGIGEACGSGTREAAGVPVLVQKYGGSSVANTERLRRVAARVVAARREGFDVVVVVSAQGDTTDDLIQKARELAPNPPRREMDMLLATGEQASIALLAIAIDALGEPVVSLTGAQGGIYTDNLYSKAKITRVSCDRIRRELAAGKIVIVAGFQGITVEQGSSDYDITTLGRGGSDTTAVALAAALQAQTCEIYTDVTGVFTADPRLVPAARKIPVISYGEMLEMASLGAVVLQPRAVELAAVWSVPIHVRSSFSDEPGTMVRELNAMGNQPVTTGCAGVVGSPEGVLSAGAEREMVVTGVTHDANVAKVVVVDVPDRPGVAARIFGALAKQRINVDMIVQTTKEKQETDLLFTVCRDDLARAGEVVRQVAHELGAREVLEDESVAKVSIVGAGMMMNPGVAAMMFETLAEQGINIQVISTSEIKVSCLVEASQVAQAVRSLHRRFLEEAGESPARTGGSVTVATQGT
ncbi:MAG: aspartate kinase [Limnochordaceae bacterium]|nr:aspartate kinase [Limnochordaceae bacterium]